MKLVFVSSTFKDMQFERDMLHSHVIPLLDDNLATYGESSRFGDLRWGVNTTELSEEESSKKVLQVCLDQIDDCKPYMIVLIGERYGWIPSQDLIKNAAILKGIDQIDDDISVTQLEIEYGALLNPDFEGRILFYFRELDKTGMSEQERKIYEAESPVHLEKINKLKEKIIKLYPNFVRTYKAKWNPKTKMVDNLQPLMDMIYNDLNNIFIKDIQKYNSLPWQERATIASKQYLLEKAKIYIDTRAIVTEYKNANQSVSKWQYPDYSCSFNYYVGKQGSGKTTRLANDYKRFHEYVDENEKYKRITIPFVYEIDNYTISFDNLFYIIIYHIENALNLKHRKYNYFTEKFSLFKESTLKYFISLIKKINKNNIIVSIFVDNVTADIIFPLLKRLERILDNIEKDTFYNNLNLEFTFALNEESLPPNVPFFDISESYPLGVLLQEDKLAIIKNMLVFARKELSETVISHLIAKKSSNDQYYLSLMLDRLLILDYKDFQRIRELGDGMEAINQYLISIIDNAGDDIKSISKELVKETAYKIDYDFVCKFLAITVYSNIYMSIDDYKDIFKYAKWDFDPLNASLILNNLKFLFIKRKNGYEFKIEHEQVNLGLLEFILENNYQYVLDILLNYVKHLPNGHSLKPFGMHFSLASNDGKFIAKYYLENVKIVKHIKRVHFDKYERYAMFIRKAVKQKKYDVLIDFFVYLCKSNIEIEHYYLVQALSYEKFNKNDYGFFTNFCIDLLDIVKKLQDTPFTTALYMFLETRVAISLSTLESVNSFSRLLLIYNYCIMNKNKLPAELVNEITIELLRVTTKVHDIDNNYDLIKIYFDDMININDSTLTHVIFKDYQKYIIKGYIAKLIAMIAYANDDKELSNKMDDIYSDTLNKGCDKAKFYNINEIAQESFVIGYFMNSFIYVDEAKAKDIQFILDYFYSYNVFPLINDIHHCYFLISMNMVSSQRDYKNLLYRAYKKATFLNYYFSDYKTTLLMIISLIFYHLDSISVSIISEIADNLETIINEVINDDNLKFEDGSDEYISSAILNVLEYLAPIFHHLSLFDQNEKVLQIIKNTYIKVNELLDNENQYVNIVLLTLLYIFEDADNEKEIDNYISEFERNYDLIDKSDTILKYYISIIVYCSEYITGDIDYDEYAKKILSNYFAKVDRDFHVNY